MFTGIIEELGIIKNKAAVTSGIRLTVGAKIILDDVKLGDSIAVNGVCQTVIAFSSNDFMVEVSAESLNVTTFKDLKAGSPVNLERALRISDRLGGHLVSGHVDGVGELVDIKDQGIFKIYTFKAPDNIARYIIYKGSVCIDGISLTISDLKDKGKIFSVALIPHTMKNTTLNKIKLGYRVNIESDLVAKYIEKFMFNRENNIADQSNISLSFLAEHGFA